MQASRRYDFQILFVLLLIVSGRVWASEASEPVPSERVAAIATDSPVTTVPPVPEDVAREVLRLQEEMGGSVAAGFGNQWSPPPAGPAPMPYQPVTRSPVSALRDVAWQLEQSAHLLESLDLYSQADALRETAARLRLDARKLKADTTSVQPE